MRKLSRMIVGVASVAAAAALVAGSVTAASADPIGASSKAVVPAYFDVVGVGSNTTEYVMDQLSVDYNKTIPAKAHNPSDPYFYSWDALPLGGNATGVYHITPKAGCKTTTRPNGSGAGLTALDTSQVDKRVTVVKGGKKYTTLYYCVDFGRSSGGRKPTSPKEGPGGVIYVAFAKDAITWAARSAASGGTDAPASLTTKQLKAIFTCSDRNWAQVGGKSAPIKVFLPQAGSGTLSTWEKFMGITTLGACVSQAPEENEGTNKALNSPNAIFIYSIGAYVAQKYRSAACGAKPTASQNVFGCNVTGVLALGKIGGVVPVVAKKINPAFPKTYFRTVYNILRWGAGTSNHIDGRLEKFFSSKATHGYLCTSPTAITAIKDYGFIPTPLCGSIS
jgi:ABC-type phosphate transport system substrate-binding protein